MIAASVDSLIADCTADIARLLTDYVTVAEKMPRQRRVIAASRIAFGFDDAKRSRNRFRERELARAVRAAKCAGGERVEVDPATGKISVIIAKPDNEATTNNALDQWLKDKNARPS
jgi:hypothetical protein